MPYPPHPAARAAQTIKDHIRRLTRLESRADQAESTVSKNTTGITAINTRLGSADLAFLATLGQMSHLGNATGSGIGTLGYGGASGWNNSAVNDYNALNSSHAALVAAFNTLLTRLVAQGFMHS